MPRLAITLGLVLLFAMGCSHGEFGEACDEDKDCKDDLQCLLEPMDTGSVCDATVDKQCGKQCVTDADCYRFGDEKCETSCISSVSYCK